MPSEPILQHALTVVAPVRRDAADSLAGTLSQHQKGVIDVLLTVRTLHFARWVILPGPRLAFESNYDGDLAEHLAELLSALDRAGLELDLFGGWEGYEIGGLLAFCRAHAFPAQTFYLGHPGLSVEQVQSDRDLQVFLETVADAIDPAGKTAIAIRRELVRAAEGTKYRLGPVDRGLPEDSAKYQFYAALFGILILAVVLLPIALVVEADERANEPRLPPISPEEEDKRDRINNLEDATALNGLTHHVPLRTNAFRKLIMRAVFWLVEIARKTLCYKGDLTGIATIHFARWVVLDDDTVLFLSNYDGSWESYLGDFVDKAHYWLSAVWMGTKQFPSTHAFVFGGAAKESEFKEWTRRWQVENQIWYSAYPHTSIANVLRNERIRIGAKGDMTEEEARAWLSLI